MKKILLLVVIMLLLCGCATNASPTIEPTDSVEPTVTIEPTITVEPTVTIEPTVKPVEATDDITKLTQGKKYSAQAELLFEFAPADPKFKTVQGAYFDGEKYYVAMTSMDETGHETVRLQVMDVNGNLIKLSDVLELAHANNITFNPKENVLVVSHCQGTVVDDEFRYSKVDIDTLEIVETNEVNESSFFAMAYCAERNSYVSGHTVGVVIDIRNEKMLIVKTCRVKPMDTISQGMFCDKDYIYYVRSGDLTSLEGIKSEIMVYDWDCRHFFQIPITFGELVEPENINIVNNSTYVICNNSTWSGGAVYKMHYSIDK